jgi:hypothetical protein
MPVTEKHEHVFAEKALDTLTKWGKNPSTDGGENIVFTSYSLSRVRQLRAMHFLPLGIALHSPAAANTGL